MPISGARSLESQDSTISDLYAADLFDRKEIRNCTLISEQEKVSLDACVYSMLRLRATELFGYELMKLGNEDIPEQCQNAIEQITECEEKSNAVLQEFFTFRIQSSPVLEQLRDHHPSLS
ncbi:hypothetical protein FGB62_171g010 [Gracilaria domingensis]|nr:hypothetical protein FGB62_171g010 [Gracilaria domingensis]